MKNKYLALFILSFIIFSADSSTAETGIKELDVLIEQAIENNPKIQSAYNNWKAEEYKIKQAESLPDPMISYSYFGKNVETRVGPQEHKYGASQKFPFPGKLSLKGKAQTKKAEILKQKYDSAVREVIKDVKFVFYDIYWVDRAIQITEEEKGILESLENVAKTKYESDLAHQQDAVKAEVELSRLIDKLLMLRQNRQSLVARLNSILNRPSDTGLDAIEEVRLLDFNYDLGDLYQMADNTSQDLISASLNIERAEYEKSLAKMDYLPDFTLGVDYIQVGSGHTTSPNDGKDAWMGTVKVNIPIWFDRLSSKVKEKNASLEASKKNYENTENNITYEIQDLYFKISTYKDIVSLYKTALIPQTEQAFDAAKIAYETGRVDFLNWLESERILLQTRIAYYKSIVDYLKSIAYLERIIGEDL